MDDPSPLPGILRTCTSCGNPVEAGDTFCEICGTKVAELPACRKCGALFLAPVKFCELCGTPVTQPGKTRVIAKEVPEPEPVADSEPEPEPEPEMEPVPVATPRLRNSAPSPKDRILKTGEEPVQAGIPPPGPEPAPVSAPAPVQVSMKKALVFGGIILFLVVIAGLYFVGLPLLTGSSAAPGGLALFPVAPTPKPPAIQTLVPTPVPTPVPTTIPPTPDTSLVPLPTEEIPKSQEVFFQVQKDPITARITVIFAGGPGINSISSGDVKVTSDDGTVQTGIIRPSTGETELTLDGSKGTDRVEVIAKMYSGQTYRVFDDLLSYMARS